ncbi:Peptidyl-prolyl isomerase cwc27 [Myotisia sp. PD_48]|nr:Peptidyl-prolyl isomerase cwc27 [Myotisia sp. PD_48]
MSAHYDTEPPPTASVTLHTTAGPIQISLFARQTPLACKNFLQHCLDGYYSGTTFHRVVSSFVIQGGDPTGSGSGGASIYEDPEFEFDPRDGEKVVFKDEIHTRLRFNRRGLVGMAKSEDGTYGSQFFVTLANTERELNGTCTMFGRVEGDSIYNVVKIADGELVEGTDRPVYAVKITGCQVDQLGPFEGQLTPREKIAVAQKGEEERKGKKKKKAKKVGKALLSFAGDDEEEDGGELLKPAKPKFNTRLVKDDEERNEKQKQKVNDKKRLQSSEADSRTHENEKAKGSASHRQSETNIPKPSISKPKPSSTNILPLRDPNTQLPLPDPENPSRSPSPSSESSPPPRRRQSLLSKTNAEIAALKASMRRDTTSITNEQPRKKTALESLIPETSIRGRKRPAPSSSTSNVYSSGDTDALKMFNSFKHKLENADTLAAKKPRQNNPEEIHTDKKTASRLKGNEKEQVEEEEEEEEAQLCDLHFIVDCQSCRAWDVPESEALDSSKANGKGRGDSDDDDESGMGWMTHMLQFGKDAYGKDLNWKKSHQDVDSLVVIDPRQKEKEIIGGRKRERERARKMEGRGNREWDRR